MKWLLVALVAGTPVKTDLTFPTLPMCLLAEESMRKQWADVYNSAREAKASEDTLKLVMDQMTRGTCIPAKGDDSTSSGRQSEDSR
jgi:hypothetical protein